MHVPIQGKDLCSAFYPSHVRNTKVEQGLLSRHHDMWSWRGVESVTFWSKVSCPATATQLLQTSLCVNIVSGC